MPENTTNSDVKQAGVFVPAEMISQIIDFISMSGTVMQKQAQSAVGISPQDAKAAVQVLANRALVPTNRIDKLAAAITANPALTLRLLTDLADRVQVAPMGQPAIDKQASNGETPLRPSGRPRTAADERFEEIMLGGGPGLFGS